MSVHNLTNDEVGRYGRQLILSEFGVKCQQQLKSSKALIVGCGGLGCPAAVYLSAAGIGTLGLLDHDVVEVSNLHRQILHKESGTGVPKCKSASAACSGVNSLPTYREHHVAINSTNALSIISQYDAVLDCTDNVATRYLLNDACVILKKPLISGAALKFEGQLTVYNHEGGPCYRCLYPVPPAANTVSSCSESGVLGVIPGIIGTMQAQEAIKVLGGMQGSLTGRLFLYDGLSFTTRVVKLRPRQPSCVVCGDTPSVTELVDYLEFCGVSSADDKLSLNKSTGMSRISPTDFKNHYRDKSKRHLLLDVRPCHEFDICKISHSINIPLNSLEKITKDELLAKISQNAYSINGGDNSGITSLQSNAGHYCLYLSSWK
ncbi:MOCS3 [Bugula neritina]|uniref:MOCS3 n=1 Tax=Bugula neritina TaxID=10212 RepID=A0A7J7K600_BUGNE|nr:MOCS3 [Bugula neritina]